MSENTPAIPEDDSPFGGMDIGALMAQAQEMQIRLAEVQQEAALTEVTGQSGNGSVQVTATGALDFRTLKIAPDLVASGDGELIEDMVLAALRDVVRNISILNEQAMAEFGSIGQFGNPTE